jgi:hypothetical protein
LLSSSVQKYGYLNLTLSALLRSTRNGLLAILNSRLKARMGFNLDNRMCNIQ